MGPSALKVLSICKWSCWKRFSLQNFSRLIHPFLPVWGISSNPRTRPSTPLFLTAFTVSSFPSTTVPAAVVHRTFGWPGPKNLDPEVPDALTHAATPVDMLPMVQTTRVGWDYPKLWQLGSYLLGTHYFPPPTSNRALDVCYHWWTDRTTRFMNQWVRVQE